MPGSAPIPSSMVPCPSAFIPEAITCKDNHQRASAQTINIYILYIERGELARVRVNGAAAFRNHSLDRVSRDRRREIMQPKQQLYESLLCMLTRQKRQKTIRNKKVANTVTVEPREGATKWKKTRFKEKTHYKIHFRVIFLYFISITNITKLQQNVDFFKTSINSTTTSRVGASTLECTRTPDSAIFLRGVDVVHTVSLETSVREVRRPPTRLLAV